jgi:phosphoglycerate dehydrogenase-like enzyme
MPPSVSAAPVPAPPSATSPTSVLLALSEQERRLFFPAHNFRETIEYADVRGMGRETWNRLLEKQRPRILITGWSTPALDMSHTANTGGSVDYVCHVAGSVRHIVSADMLKAGLKVTNWSTLIAPQVAEHALLTILALMRNLGLWRDALTSTQSASPTERLATRTLHGKNVSIHGFGSIARELIRLLRPFDVSIRVFSAGVPDSLIREHHAKPVSSLVKLAAKADVFVTCEALTPVTRKSINAEVLGALPEGTAFVNVGRGAVVDEVALAEVAKFRNLRIGSDVFAFEPLPADSPLLSLPGAILSPHIAGPTLDAYVTCGRHALANIERYLEGRPLSGLVTPEIFSRST